MTTVFVAKKIDVDPSKIRIFAQRSTAMNFAESEVSKSGRDYFWETVHPRRYAVKNVGFNPQMVEIVETELH